VVGRGGVAEGARCEAKEGWGTLSPRAGLGRGCGAAESPGALRAGAVAGACGLGSWCPAERRQRRGEAENWFG
jgi:hypothetical protein